MKTIYEGKGNILKLLGEQRVKDTDYRLMRYVLCVECEQGILLHNAITGKMVLLDDEEKNIIGNLPCHYTDTMKGLIQDYYFVPLEFNEENAVIKLRKIAKRLFEPEGINAYTILTTTNCNARCFYCYENNLPRINMSEHTAAQLAEYMVAHKGEGALKLHWFGGEPLVAVERIDQICKELCLQQVQFISTMTSNGYLFTKPMIERASEQWKLGTIQITLDGTEDVYNKTKSYITANDNPYHRVLDNIGLLLSHNMHVIIRLNLDQHNTKDLYALIEELHRRFDKPKNLEVYSHLLFEDAGTAPIERDADTRDFLYNEQVKMNEYLTELGLCKTHQSLPFLKTHKCMADISNSVVVYPDGRLFKCEHVEMGDEIGNLSTDEYDEAKIEKYLKTTKLDACSKCPLFPSCILLQSCQGTMDFNTYTCQYSINSHKKAVIEAYKKQKGLEPV